MAWNQIFGCGKRAHPCLHFGRTSSQDISSQKGCRSCGFHWNSNGAKHKTKKANKLSKNLLALGINPKTVAMAIKWSTVWSGPTSPKVKSRNLGPTLPRSVGWPSLRNVAREHPQWGPIFDWPKCWIWICMCDTIVGKEASYLARTLQWNLVCEELALSHSFFFTGTLQKDRAQVHSFTVLACETRYGKHNC